MADVVTQFDATPGRFRTFQRPQENLSNQTPVPRGILDASISGTWPATLAADSQMFHYTLSLADDFAYVLQQMFFSIDVVATDMGAADQGTFRVQNWAAGSNLVDPHYRLTQGGTILFSQGGTESEVRNWTISAGNSPRGPIYSRTGSALSVSCWGKVRTTGAGQTAGIFSGIVTFLVYDIDQLNTFGMNTPQPVMPFGVS